MKNLKSCFFIFSAIFLGLLTGIFHFEIVFKIAEAIAALFINFLKFIAAPIVFLSIFSSLLGMDSYKEMKFLGRKIFIYTILTTIIAASIALILYLIINPSRTVLSLNNLQQVHIEQKSYVSFFINIVPSNFIQMFLENNVIGIAFISFIFGIAALKLPDENKETLNKIFSAFFKLVLKITELIIFLMPIGVWAFISLLVKDVRKNSAEFKSIILYLSVVLAANLFQGFIVIPLLLKFKGISPIKTVKGAAKALVLAFFSKSSNVALPVSMQCSINSLKIKQNVANFSLPLCTVINMNGCAAFILTTVIFVSQMNGIVFSGWNFLLWIVLSSMAAIGNAGVPMGCFFLSSAFLIAMKVPIKLMGIILPFYTFLDMIETALNVWSDICITKIVDKETEIKDSKLEFLNEEN